MNVTDVMPSPLLAPTAGSQASTSNVVSSLPVMVAPSLDGLMISRCAGSGVAGGIGVGGIGVGGIDVGGIGVGGSSSGGFVGFGGGGGGDGGITIDVDGMGVLGTITTGFSVRAVSGIVVSTATVAGAVETICVDPAGAVTDETGVRRDPTRVAIRFSGTEAGSRS